MTGWVRVMPGAFGGSGDRKWLVASSLVAVLVVAPVVSLAFIASRGSGDLWPHIFAFVLPQALKETAILLAGVGFMVVTLGTALAWLMTAYEFPGRRIFDWALLLPLATPTYIVAFAYLDLLHPIGPIQSALRALLGVEEVRGLWFPEVRSMTGCILLLGFVLYPYVYLSTRAMFLMQAGSLLEASRTLGASRSRMFFRVALPLARPAIAVGASLALMEALNDIGASEFLGVRTLSVSIYSTWINRSNLPGAAQIALAMLVIVVSLILLERWARRRQRYVSMAQRVRRAAPVPLKGWRAARCDRLHLDAHRHRLRASRAACGQRGAEARAVRRRLAADLAGDREHDLDLRRRDVRGAVAGLPRRERGAAHAGAHLAARCCARPRSATRCPARCSPSG